MEFGCTWWISSICFILFTALSSFNDLRFLSWTPFSRLGNSQIANWLIFFHLDNLKKLKLLGNSFYEFPAPEYQIKLIYFGKKWNSNNEFLEFTRREIRKSTYFVKQLKWAKVNIQQWVFFVYFDHIVRLNCLL